MPQTAPISRLKLNLPDHVVRMLEDWTYNELHSTPQEAVEGFLEELCVNGQLVVLRISRSCLNGNAALLQGH